MYIAIEGVIGVGKTTLARMLQANFEAELLLEIFEENPFLSDFYGDRARYAFQTQIFFLLSRYHQQRKGVREAWHPIPGCSPTTPSTKTRFLRRSTWTGMNWKCTTGSMKRSQRRSNGLTLSSISERIPTF